MKLIYDIAVMAQLVAACESANSEIVKAEQLVQQVRSHGDWTCKEKSVIDELMQECKQLVQRMREDQSSFLRVLKDVEGELNDTENSVSNLFSGVESILGKVLGIPVAVAHVVGGGLLGAASAIGQTPFGNAVTQAWDQWTEKIDIQNQMMDQFDPDHVGTGWAGDFIEKMKEIGEDILDTDVIWHGPPQIGIPTGILDSVNNIGGIGTIIGDSIVKPEIIAPVADIDPDIADAIDVGLGAIDIQGIWENAIVPDAISGQTEAFKEYLNKQVEKYRILQEFQEMGQKAETWTDSLFNNSQPAGNDIFHTVTEAMDRVQDRVEMLSKITGTTAYPLPDAIPVAIPVGQWVSNVGSNIWNQVQDSSIGDAVQDALRNLTEDISVCSMDNLSL